MSQKFCNILVTWCTIRQLRILLLSFWRWRTTLDSKMQSSPDTLRVLLAGFVFMPSQEIHRFRPACSCLIIKVLTTRANFLESSSYCTVINCSFNFCATTFKDCFCCVMAQFELVIYIRSRIKQRCIYISTTFKSLTTTIRAATYCFTHVIYAPLTDIYQTIAKTLAHPNR